MSVNLHFSGNLFFIVGFCERKFRTVISGFLFFFFQVTLSRDPGWERREINPDRSRKKKETSSQTILASGMLIRFAEVAQWRLVHPDIEMAQKSI